MKERVKFQCAVKCDLFFLHIYPLYQLPVVYLPQIANRSNSADNVTDNLISPSLLIRYLIRCSQTPPVFDGLQKQPPATFEQRKK